MKQFLDKNRQTEKLYQNKQLKQNTSCSLKLKLKPKKLINSNISDKYQATKNI